MSNMQTTSQARRARRARARQRRATLRTMRRPVPALVIRLADGTMRKAERIVIGADRAPGFMCPYCSYASEGTECRNPMCDTWLSLDGLAARRHATEVRAASAKREADLQASLAASRAERAEADQLAYNAAMAQARDAGQCTACLAHSMRRGGSPKFVKHRDAANCPQTRGITERRSVFAPVPGIR